MKIGNRIGRYENRNQLGTITFYKAKVISELLVAKSLSTQQFLPIFFNMRGKHERLAKKPMTEQRKNNIAQCPRTDLNKRILPRPKITTT